MNKLLNDDQLKIVLNSIDTLQNGVLFLVEENKKLRSDVDELKTQVRFMKAMR